MDELKSLRRRQLLCRLAAVSPSATALAFVSNACGWLAPRVPRIGYLSPGPREVFATRVDAFLDGLRDLGYMEGQTVAIEWRFTPPGTNAQFHEMAGELVRLPVDVLVTYNTAAAQAAKDATRTIPIVAVNVGLPVQSGLVSSLARPGGNLTGLAADTPGLPAKSLDLLRQVVPDLSRLAVLVDGANPANVAQWNDVRDAAETAGIQAEQVDLRTTDELEQAFQTPVLYRAQAVMCEALPLLIPVYARLAGLLLQHHLPGVAPSYPMPEASLLLTYGPDFPAVARRGAVYVDRILKGANPADLPVEQPTVFDFAVNLKTAQTLGIAIPHDLASQVTQWIQ